METLLSASLEHFFIVWHFFSKFVNIPTLKSHAAFCEFVNHPSRCDNITRQRVSSCWSILMVTVGIEEVTSGSLLPQVVPMPPVCIDSHMS